MNVHVCTLSCMCIRADMHALSTKRRKCFRALFYCLKSSKRHKMNKNNLKLLKLLLQFKSFFERSEQRPHFFKPY